MSYVAYKEDFCFNLFIPQENYTFNVSYFYSGEPQYLFSFVYFGMDCMGFPFYNSFPVDMCLIPYSNDWSNAMTSHAKDASHSIAAEDKAVVDYAVSRDFVHQFQNQKMYYTYMTLVHGDTETQTHSEKRNTDKNVEDMTFGTNYSWPSWSWTSSSSYSYYYYAFDAEFELFARWHDYSFMWLNVPRLSSYPTMQPTAYSNKGILAAGWMTEKYSVNDTIVVIESARRTHYCIPFYREREVEFHYVVKCGTGMYDHLNSQSLFYEMGKDFFEVTFYLHNDTTCMMDSEYSFRQYVWNGPIYYESIGERYFYDINYYNFSCSAGLEDPLTDHFVDDHYAVQV